MIHIEVTINNETSVDLYYAIEDVKSIKILTDQYNMKTVMYNDIILYENVFDVVIEVI